jgi:hypothetical protein
VAWFGVSYAAEQDVFLGVLIRGAVWVGGVWAWDVGTWAGNDVVSSWVEAGGILSVKGVARGPSEYGHGCKAVMGCCSCSYGGGWDRV